MKKNIMLLAAGAMLLMGGCSKSEIDEGSLNATNAISFSASSNKATKAAAVTNDNVQDYPFGVFAYYTKADNWASYTGDKSVPNFMNNQKVSYSDGNGWTYSPVKYWPNTSGEMISFFGYMPYDETNVVATVDATGMPAIEFTQTMIAMDDTDGTNEMVDLVVAKALDQTKTTSAVSLPFKHVLSRLNFAAKVDHDLAQNDGTYATKVFVKGLRILGTEEHTVVETETDKVPANSASKFYKTASYTMSAESDDNGAWSYGSAEKQEAALNATAILNATSQSFGAKTPAYSTESVALSNTGSSTSLLTSGEYLFLIPPSENGVEAETDVVLQIDYDIVTADAKVDAGYTKSSTTATLSMPNGTIKEGIAYNVVMTIGLNEVKLTASPTDWVEPETEVDAIEKDVTVYNSIEIEDVINDAFIAGLAGLKVTYLGSDDELAITIPTPATGSETMAINLDLTGQTGDVTITTDPAYDGAMIINAPEATVTINGDSYENLTVWTADNTLVIAEGTTVNGLTIEKGNVVVYGELTGDVVRGVDNTDTKTIITVMEGATYSGTTYEESDPVKVVKIDDLADGRYYSIDDGDWTFFSTANEITALGSSYTKIALMSKGDNTSISPEMLLAFYNNENLLEWDLGKAYCTVNIGNVFENKAQKLKKAVLPSGLTNIYPNFFKGLTELKEVVLQDGVENIKNDCFKGCTNLSKIVLPASTTQINQYAFSGCSSLENINLENVEIIEKYCFEKCNIKNLVLGDKLTTIGYYAFTDNLNLETTTLPTSIKSENLGGLIFRNTNISTFTWPSSLEVVQASFFLNLKNLKSVEIPSTVTTIGQSAFNGSGIESITIPSSVKLFDGFWAFCNCTSLTEIIYEDGCQITTIPDGCFNGLLNIEEMVIPASITEIKNIGIWKCRKLSTIICKASTMPKVYEKSLGGIESTGVNAYNGTEVSAGTPKVLYVPANLVDTYKAETTDGKPLNEVTDADGKIIETNENFWYTVLQKECGYVVKALDENGNIPTLE